MTWHVWRVACINILNSFAEVAAFRFTDFFTSLASVASRISRAQLRNGDGPIDSFTVVIRAAHPTIRIALAPASRRGVSSLR